MPAVTTPYGFGTVQVYSGNIVVVRLGNGSKKALNPAQPSTGQLITGGGNQPYVNAVGLGQSATISTDAGLQVASGIGDNRVQQWVPGNATVSVTITDMVIRLQDFGASQRVRSYESLGVAPVALLDLLQMNTFDVDIVDMGSRTTLKSIRDCLYANGTLNIQKHVPFTVDITFNGLDTSGNMTVPVPAS